MTDRDAAGLVRMGPWLVLIVAMAATLSGLENGFAYDDVPIVQDDARLHSLRALSTVLARPYWPDAEGGQLWRPLTLAGFTLQWALGDGRPIVFHLGNTLLTMATALLALRWYGHFLTPLRALAGALLFAALPVHAEVTANVVGQGELWCTIFVLGALLVWMQEPGARPARAALLAIMLIGAAMAKEQGFTAPAILFAAEFLRPGGRRRWPDVWRDLALPTGALTALFAGRAVLLGGLGSGEPIPALASLSAVDRVLTMLDLLPRALATLAWPTRLVADYNPGDVRLAGHPDASPIGGALLLVAILLVCFTSPRRREAFALLVLAAAAFAPVANVLFASGVIFAERHLFLPSVALAALPALLLPAARRPALRTALACLVLAAVALGVRRSAERHRVWKDTPTLIRSIVADAPENYRGLMLLAGQLRITAPDSAEALLRIALARFEGDARVHEDLGQFIRRREGCAAALGFFQRAVLLQPSRETARARAAACARELPPEQRREAIVIHRPDSVATGIPQVGMPPDSSADSTVVRLDSVGPAVVPSP